MRKHCWSFPFVLGILGIFLPLLSSATGLLTVRGIVGPPGEEVPIFSQAVPYLSISGEDHWKDFIGPGGRPSADSCNSVQTCICVTPCECRLPQRWCVSTLWAGRGPPCQFVGQCVLECRENAGRENSFIASENRGNTRECWERGG